MLDPAEKVPLRNPLPAAQAGIATQHKDELQPGQADAEGGHNLVDLDVGLEGEGGDGEGVDQQVAPVL